MQYADHGDMLVQHFIVFLFVVNGQLLTGSAPGLATYEEFLRGHPQPWLSDLWSQLLEGEQEQDSLCFLFVFLF